MMTRSSSPDLSVVVPTYRRPELLEGCLASLGRQALPRDRYEVLVVDDEPSPRVAALCGARAGDMQVRYLPQQHAGISAAKNRGLIAARAPLVLFFDDDDVADRRLLLVHVLAHLRYPDETVAVLGFTGWHPMLPVNAAMEYAVERGHLLSCYPALRHGQSLDYRFFWGGRSSCKRSLLHARGVFDERFVFGCEDIELGYRLAARGFSVRFQATARSYMARSVTFDDLCARCELQGRSQWSFYRLHPVPEIASYCMTDIAHEAWGVVADHLSERVARARALTAKFERATEPRDEAARDELEREYWWCFTAYKIKGMIEARAADPAPPVAVLRASVEGAPVVAALRAHLAEAAS